MVRQAAGMVRKTSRQGGPRLQQEFMPASRARKTSKKPAGSHQAGCGKLVSRVGKSSKQGKEVRKRCTETSKQCTASRNTGCGKAANRVWEASKEESR